MISVKNASVMFREGKDDPFLAAHERRCLTTAASVQPHKGVGYRRLSQELKIVALSLSSSQPAGCFELF